MAVQERAVAAWIEELRAGAGKSVSEAEKRRRGAETGRLLAARDQVGSIAPDSIAEYVRQVRDEANPEPAVLHPLVNTATSS